VDNLLATGGLIASGGLPLSDGTKETTTMRDGITTETVSMGAPHRQWASRKGDERFETLEALRASVHGRRMRAVNMDVDEVSKPEAFTVLEDAGNAGGVWASIGGYRARPTNWGFGQVAALAGAPAGYLRTLSSELAVRNLQYGLENKPTRGKARMMVVDPIDGDRKNPDPLLYAATSQTYGRIWDAEVVDSVQEVVTRTGNIFFNPKDWSGRPSGLYASDHDVFVFMIDGGSLVDGGSERDQLHRGFFVWNSEVGAAEFGIQTFCFRVCCGNHLIWDPSDVKALRIRHTSKAPERFVEHATPRLQEYLMQSTDAYVAGIKEAKAYGLPKEPKDVEQWIVDHGFTHAEARRGIAAAVEEEGACSNLWEAVQGLTASARKMAFMDARVELERRAGSLMDLTQKKRLAA
jgi:hypothetical protein